jgi:hypothetical protein
MHKIISTHPIATFFFTQFPNMHFTQFDQLHQIYETVLMGGYQTLEEWRRDTRLLRNSTTSALGAIAAAELQRLFDKAYHKLCSSTFTVWVKRILEQQQRLLHLLQQSPCSVSLIGSTGLLLQRLSCAPNSGLSDPTRRFPHPLGISASRSVQTALVRDWQGVRLLEKDGEDAFFVHMRTFPDLVLDPALPIKIPVRRCIEPESPPVVESPPLGLPSVSLEQPRQLAAESCSSARIHPSLLQRNAKPLLRPLTPPTPPPDQTESPFTGMVVPARRGRAASSRSTAGQGDLPTEPEIRAFMVASQLLSKKGDLIEMCMILLQHEPWINPDDPIVDVDLAMFKPQTVRALIDFAKQRFRRLGYAYPKA